MDSRFYYKNNILDIYKVTFDNGKLTVYIANKKENKVDSLTLKLDDKLYSFDVFTSEGTIVVEQILENKYTEPSIELVSCKINGKIVKIENDEEQKEYFVSPRHVSFLSYEKHLYQRYLSKKLGRPRNSFKFIANENEDYWSCACGNHNFNSIKTCSECGLNKETLIKHVNEVPFDKYRFHTHQNVSLNTQILGAMTLLYIVYIYVIMFLFNGDILYSNTYMNDVLGVLSRVILPIALIGVTIGLILSYSHYTKILTGVLKGIRIGLLLFFNILFIFKFIRTSYNYVLVLGFDVIMIYYLIMQIKNNYFRIHKIVELSLIVGCLITGFVEQKNYSNYNFTYSKDGIYLRVDSIDTDTYEIPNYIGGERVTCVTFTGESYNFNKLIINSNLERIGCTNRGAFKKLTDIVVNDNDLLVNNNGVLMDKETKNVYLVESDVTSVTIDWSEVMPHSFDTYPNIKEIHLTSNVTKINEYAFANCTSLTTIDYGEDSNLLTIENNVFENCTSLVDFKIPDSVENIGNYILGGCLNLKTLTLPFIGNKRYTSLNTYSSTALINLFVIGHDFSISLPELQLDKIIIRNQGLLYYSSFYGLNVKEIEFTNLTGKLNVNTFANTTLEKFVVPEGVTEISRMCFKKCTKLKELTLSPNITKIEENAFQDVDFTNVTLNLNGFDISNCDISETGNQSFISKVNSLI